MSCDCKHPANNDSTYQYAAKLVCGRLDKPNPLAIGEYRTAVNIHNPSRCDTVVIRWKVAIGANLESDHRFVTGLSKVSLGPDEAVEIDCPEVHALLDRSGFKGAFAKGWVVLECDDELDVVAVYTSSHPKDPVVNSVHTERVCARVLEKCQDLHLSVSTGSAAWTLEGNDDHEIATLGKPNDLAKDKWNDLSGSVWVHDPDQAVQGLTVYQLCFDLCFGFEDPRLSLTMLADNRARAVLNGQVMNGPTYSKGNQAWHTTNNADFTKPVTVTSSPGMFRVGRNCIQIFVQNDNGPTGLCVNGSLNVGRGMCPGAALPILPCPGICYQGYRRTVGWGGTHCNGETCGVPDPDTLGKRRTKAFRVWLTNSVPGMSVRYRAEKGTGLTNWESDGSVCGNTGLFGKLFQIEVQLVNAPPHCQVQYRANNRGEGWTNWTSSGLAGSTNDRMDAFEIRIV